jgi:hypothetical protein
MAISDLFSSKYGDFGAFFFPKKTKKKKNPLCALHTGFFWGYFSIKEHWLYY